MPPTELDEVGARLSGEVARSIIRIGDQALLLESIAGRSFSLSCDLFRDAKSEELSARAHEVRGVVLHALAVLAELQYLAGRLDALAALRAVSGDAD